MKIVIVSGFLLNIMDMSDIFQQSICLVNLFVKLIRLVGELLYERSAILPIIDMVVVE